MPSEGGCETEGLLLTSDIWLLGQISKRLEEWGEGVVEEWGEGVRGGSEGREWREGGSEGREWWRSEVREVREWGEWVGRSEGREWGGGELGREWGEGMGREWGRARLSSKTLTSASTTATLPVATAKCNAKNEWNYNPSQLTTFSTWKYTSTSFIISKVDGSRGQFLQNQWKR